MLDFRRQAAEPGVLAEAQSSCHAFQSPWRQRGRLCARTAALLVFLAGFTLLQGCSPFERVVISVRILATDPDATLKWVDVSSSLGIDRPDCTIPHLKCEYETLIEETISFEAMGDGFDRWECSGITSLPALRTFSERNISGFVDGEDCAAIFCTTRDVHFDVDVGTDGARATVDYGHVTNKEFIVFNGRVRFGNRCTSNSSCIARVCQGETLIIRANEELFRFAGFSGDCEADADDRHYSTLVVDDDKTCTATFEPIVMEIGVIGNGRVVSTPARIDCTAANEATCLGAFPLNRVVDLHAQADPGAAFLGWGEACASAAGTETAQVRMDGDHQCMARFEPLGIAPGEPGVLELASVFAFANVAVGGTHAFGPGRMSDLSADGRSVVFRSLSVYGPNGEPTPNTFDGIYHRDLVTNTTEFLVQASDDLREGMELSVSADGRFVAFVSGDPALTGNIPFDPTQQAFVYDRETNAKRRVSVDDPAHSVELIQSSVFLFSDGVVWVEISANGRYVVFSAERTSDSHRLIYVRDTCAGAPAGCIKSTRVVSVNDAGTVPNQGWSAYPSISADGRFVAFASTSTLLIPGEPDQSSYRPVFVHDRDADGNGLFDETGSACLQPPCITTRPVSPRNDNFFYPRISASGRFVAYIGTDNAGASVYVHDTVSGTTHRLQGDGLTALGDQHFSGDGRFITFTTNPTSPDFAIETAVQDTCIGAPPGCTSQTRIVSRNAAGDPAEAPTSDARISGDGRLVSFGTGAGNLILPYDFDYDPDVFVAASGFARTPGDRPNILRLPMNLQAGVPEQLLAIDGAGFVPGVSVLWSGEPRPTIYINATRLEFRATAADLALPTRVSVEVLNPGGSVSDPALLEVLE